MQPQNFTFLKFLSRYFTIALTMSLLLFIEIGATQEHGDHDAHKAANASSLNVALHTEPNTVQVGTPTSLTFHLTDAKGEPFTDLLVHHERVLHVLIVSENLQIIGHVHPEDFESRDMLAELEGHYTVHFTFPAAGRYILAIDVMTADTEFSKYLYVDVKGTPKMADMPHDFRREKAIRGYTDEGGDRYTKAVSVTDSVDEPTYHVKMETPKRIQAGEMVTIGYYFSRNGKPITDLVPFLDAPMHFAIVSTRLDGVIHTHGNVPSNKHDAHATKKQEQQAGHTSHEAHKTPKGKHKHHSATPEKFGPTVNLMTMFPKAGVYQIFGQLKHTDQILWLSFMVEVVDK